MRQQITAKHTLDADGNPTGGTATGVGIDIRWQDGPLGRGKDRKEPNGAFVEGVIEAALGRLKFYQWASDGRFACRENDEAIMDLQDALTHLMARTAKRDVRGVEGTYEE